MADISTPTCTTRSLSDMGRLDAERIHDLLQGAHQAVLSVNRSEKGPVAVPMSYHFDGERFFMVTSPSSLHGKLMAKAGRATVTVQYERVDAGSVHQWYVMAEGPVTFTDADPAPHVRTILVKDRGPHRVDAWRASTPATDARVAELVPERISGYEFRETLGD